MSNNDELSFTEQLILAFPKDLPEPFTPEFWRVVDELRWDYYLPDLYPNDFISPQEVTHWTIAESVAVKYAYLINAIVDARYFLMEHAGWDIDDFFKCGLHTDDALPENAFRFLSFNKYVVEQVNNELDSRYELSTDRTRSPLAAGERQILREEIPFSDEARHIPALNWFLFHYAENNAAATPKDKPSINCYQWKVLEAIKKEQCCISPEEIKEIPLLFSVAKDRYICVDQDTIWLDDYYNVLHWKYWYPHNKVHRYRLMKQKEEDITRIRKQKENNNEQ